MKQLPLLFLCIAATALSGFKADLTAEQILKKAEAKLLSSTMVAELDITVQRPKWSKQMSLKTWTKGTEYAMAYVMGPAKDKGTVYLKSGDNVWNFLPKIKKTIKIPSTLLSQSWMGTDLSTDDLVKLSSLTTDYTAKRVGYETVSGRSCYKLELTPKDESDVLWGKLVICIDKVDFIQLKTIFYDEDLEEVNILTGSEIKTLGGKKLASKYVMKPAGKSNQSSTVVYKSMKFNSPLNTSFFTKDNMSKVQP